MSPLAYEHSAAVAQFDAWQSAVPQPHGPQQSTHDGQNWKLDSLMSEDDIRRLLGITAPPADAPQPQQVEQHRDAAAAMAEPRSSTSGELDEVDLWAAVGTGGKGGKTKANAKNAQQRYRERQKTRLQEAEQKIAELSAELRTLHMKKESMAMRNQLLEKQLPQAATEPDGLPAPPSVVLDADWAWWLDEHTKRLLIDFIGLGEVITVSVGPGPPLELPREQVENMPADEFAALWQRYIAAFAELLLEATPASPPECPALQRLARLVVEGWHLHATIGLKHPDHHAKHSSMRKQRSTPAPSGAALLRAVMFTPVQRKAVLGLRRLYLLNLGAVLVRRQQLTGKVQACGIGGHTGLELEDLQTLVTHTNELADTLRAEHGLHIQFIAGVWRQVLTPVQSATLQVHAYPIKADVSELIEVLATDVGEKSAEDLMAEGAAMRPEALSPLDGALAVLKQHAAAGGGLVHLPCCGRLAGGVSCEETEKYSC